MFTIMSPIIQIKESTDELNSFYKESVSHIKPRIHMLLKIKKYPAVTKSKLSRELRISYNSVNGWCTLYAEGGIKKLLEFRETRYHHNSKYYTGFSPHIYKAIEKRHKKEPFESYVELHSWMKDNYFPGVKYPTLVRYISNYFGEQLRITGILHMHIHESLAELEHLYAKSMSRLKLRIGMLIEIKKDETISRKELAHTLGVSYGSILKWSALYEEGGLNKICKYRSPQPLGTAVYDFIRKKIELGDFTTNADLHREIQKSIQPDLKYYTLNRYLAKYFSKELNVLKVMKQRE
jgi:transposase